LLQCMSPEVAHRVKVVLVGGLRNNGGAYPVLTSGRTAMSDHPRFSRKLVAPPASTEVGHGSPPLNGYAAFLSGGFSGTLDPLLFLRRG
jgi:hypothetical protein